MFKNYAQKSYRALILDEPADYHKIIEAIKHVEPHTTHSYNNLGLAYFEIDEFSQAEAYFNAAIQADTTNATAHINRGDVYVKLEQFKQAEQDYTKAITLEPNEVSHYRTRGYFYEERGEIQKAIQDLEQAVQLDLEFEYTREKLAELKNRD